MPDLDYKASQTVELDEVLQKHLHTILEHCENENRYARQQQIKESKQLDHFWHGLQHIFWDKNLSDWKIPTHEQLDKINSETDFIYDYVINIFKAHGESIIAALSAELPYVAFSPVDAEAPLDIRTSKAATNAAQMIQDYNESKLIFIHALFCLFNSHFIASYTYHNSDNEYGTISIPKYENQEIKTTPDTYHCSECAFMSDGAVDNCPECMSPTEMIPGKMEFMPIKIGYEEIAKGREIIDIMDVKEVKVPTYAKNQKGCGYLIHYSDLHYAYVSSIYGKDFESSTSANEDDFERQMRTPSTSYVSSQEEDKQLTTVKRLWIRPWLFWIIKKEDEESYNNLMATFPNGARCDFVGNEYAASYAESLDDAWTITKGGPSRTVHSTPLGSALIPVQEIKNIIRNLGIEIIERGIPIGFADPETLSFQEFEQSETGVGQIYPAKRKSGSALGDSFHEMKSASLSKEYTDFDRVLDGDGQFVVGDYPSVRGAPGEGSKTLGEYVESREYALQRLSIPWQYISIWWGQTIHKSIISMFAHLVQDEQMAMKDGDIFKNIWVKQADSKGKFKLLVPDVSTEFPTSLARQRSLLFQLAQLQSPEINSFLYSPENASATVRTIGLRGFKIPGQDQALKQLREIEILVRPDEMGQYVPVQVEQDVDDNNVHIQTLTNFLVSDAGQDLKENDRLAYDNCIAHLTEHKILEQQKMIQQQMMQLPGEEQNVEAGGVV